MGGVQAQLEGLAVRGEYLFSTGPQAGTPRSLTDLYGPERARGIQALYRQCRDLDLAATKRLRTRTFVDSCTDGQHRGQTSTST